MRSLCCKWQKTNPEPSCQTRNLSAQEAKRPSAYVASEWHLYPVLPLGLTLLWTVRSFSDMHSPLSYKTAASSAYGYNHPVYVCDTHLCSTFPAMLFIGSDSAICPSLNQGGNINGFLLLKWGYVAQSCDHHLVTMTGEEDTRTLKMDRTLSSGWCYLATELNNPGSGLVIWNNKSSCFSFC